MTLAVLLLAHPHLLVFPPLDEETRRAECVCMIYFSDKRGEWGDLLYVWCLWHTCPQETKRHKTRREHTIYTISTLPVQYRAPHEKELHSRLKNWYAPLPKISYFIFTPWSHPSPHDFWARLELGLLVELGPCSSYIGILPLVY